MKKIILATRNSGKVAEIREILKPEDYELLSLDDVGFKNKIEETGNTFLENALLKAETVYESYRMPVIAEDSGLCVEALEGRPGVFSARYSGDNGDDRKNIELLLKELKNTPFEKRGAFFICVAVLYYAPGRYFTAEGKVRGYIGFEPAGSHGFGYDPVFYLPEYGKTFAELPLHIKNRLSHRYYAFKKIGEFIENNLSVL